MSIKLSNNKHTSSRIRARLKRQVRGRKKVAGTAERPRLVVTRSAKHISVQVVDDLVGKTLAYVGSSTAEVRGADQKNGGNIAAAKVIGRAIAERAKAIGVTKVAFDRGGRQYHGRVKALADAAREGGLKF